MEVGRWEKERIEAKQHREKERMEVWILLKDPFFIVFTVLILIVLLIAIRH